MKWISVEDRLPSKTRQVEVVFYAQPYAWETGLFTPADYNPKFGLKNTEGDIFQRHDLHGDDCYYTVEGVTHWMPLPEPPDEKA